MPTAVLMMIGQIEVMKITKMAEGWPSRNAARESGSPGQRRNRAQHLEDRVEAAHGPVRLADQGADHDAHDGGQGEAEGDALDAGIDVPEQALVGAAIVVERVGDDVPTPR